MNSAGCTERTFRLQTTQRFGKQVWAWIYDDNGWIYKDQFFDTEEAAKEYMNERTKGSFVVQTPISK